MGPTPTDSEEYSGSRWLGGTDLVAEARATFNHRLELPGIGCTAYYSLDAVVREAMETVVGHAVAAGQVPGTVAAMLDPSQILVRYLGMHMKMATPVPTSTQIHGPTKILATVINLRNTDLMALFLTGHYETYAKGEAARPMADVNDTYCIKSFMEILRSARGGAASSLDDGSLYALLKKVISLSSPMYPALETHLITGPADGAHQSCKTKACHASLDACAPGAVVEVPIFEDSKGAPRDRLYTHGNLTQALRVADLSDARLPSLPIESAMADLMPPVEPHRGGGMAGAGSAGRPGPGLVTPINTLLGKTMTPEDIRGAAEKAKDSLVTEAALSRAKVELFRAVATTHLCGGEAARALLASLTPEQKTRRPTALCNYNFSAYVDPRGGLPASIQPNGTAPKPVPSLGLPPDDAIHLFFARWALFRLSDLPGSESGALGVATEISTVSNRLRETTEAGTYRDPVQCVWVGGRSVLYLTAEQHLLGINRSNPAASKTFLEPTTKADKKAPKAPVPLLDLLWVTPLMTWRGLVLWYLFNIVRDHVMGLRQVNPHAHFLELTNATPQALKPMPTPARAVAHLAGLLARTDTVAMDAGRSTRTGGKGKDKDKDRTKTRDRDRGRDRDGDGDTGSVISAVSGSAYTRPSTSGASHIMSPVIHGSPPEHPGAVDVIITMVCTPNQTTDPIGGNLFEFPQCKYVVPDLSGTVSHT